MIVVGVPISVSVCVSVDMKMIPRSRSSSVVTTGSIVWVGKTTVLKLNSVVLGKTAALETWLYSVTVVVSSVTGASTGTSADAVGIVTVVPDMTRHETVDTEILEDVGVALDEVIIVVFAGCFELKRPINSTSELNLFMRRASRFSRCG